MNRPFRPVLAGLTFPLGPALLLAALAALAFAARPLTPIDETRYLGVAWEMWLRGDYFVLYKNGAPYSHKPPLLFWLYNLGWMLTGVNEWWPRLVQPLFSLGCLGLSVALARRLWPRQPQAGRHAAWILASSLLWMLFSTSGMFDVMLTFFILLGMRGLLVAADGMSVPAGPRPEGQAKPPRRSTPGVPQGDASLSAERALPARDRHPLPREGGRGAGRPVIRGFAWLAFSIGLGVLAKGPVVLLHLLPVAVLAPWWRPGLAWKRWYGGVLLAVLGGAAIALAWAIPAAVQGGEEYRRMIFWGQTANRMVDSFAHKRAFWWYLPLLPALSFPWLLWPALWRRFAAMRREGLDGGQRLCLAWLAPVLLFLSLISGKQIHYLIPLFPPFALLAGRLLADAKPGGLWLPALLAAATGAAMVWLAPDGLTGKLDLWENLPRWPGGVLVAAAAAALWLGRNAARRLPALALLGAASFALLQCYVADNLWRRYDIRPLARQIKALQARGVPVANHGEYHAQYQFFGRLEKPIDELATPAQIQPWFEKHPDGVLIMYVTPKPGEAPPLYSQPYIGETAQLLDAGQLRARGYLR